MRALLVLAALVLTLAVWWAWSRHADPAPLVAGASQPNAAADEAALEPIDELADAAATPRRTQITALDPVLPADVQSRIVGRAVDDEGTPLGGAEADILVLGVDELEPSRSSATSDAIGRFAFALPYVVPPEARVKITVHATTFHATVDRTLPSVTDEAPRTWMECDNDVGDFVLARCGTLRGRVVTEAGVPIDPAFIELYPATNGRRTGSTTAKGEFQLNYLPPDSYRIGVRSVGWMPTTTEPIAIRFGEATAAPDIVLAPAPTIRGVVVDEAGVGVFGMRIEGRSPASGETTSTKTRAGGAFVLYLSAPEPTPIRVRGYEHEFENARGEATFVPGAADARIVLKRLPRMHFLVVDEKRAPIERFGIALSIVRSSPDVTDFGSYGVNIQTTLGNHPRGEWSTTIRGVNTVVVRAPKHAPVKLPVVADAGRTDVQTIQMEREATIAGRVRIDGQPFALCSVRIAPDRGDPRRHSLDAAFFDRGESLLIERTLRANADGEFEFDELCAGSYMLEVSGKGASPRVLPGIVIAREQALHLGDIDLTRAASVRGVVLTSSGESPSGFRVKLDGRVEQSSDEDGRFEFSGLDAGSHNLVWSRPFENEAFVDSSRRTVTFDVGSGEDREVVIDARDSARCSLTVRVLREGKPASGVAVHATFTEETPAPYSPKLCVTDAHGVATAKLDSDRALRIDVLDAEQHVLGGSGRMIGLVPGGRVDETIHLEVGTIVVELPPTFVPVSDGHVTLWFSDFVQPSSTACARGSSWSCDREWNSSTVDFGGFRAGSYDVTVGFQRWLPPAKIGIDPRSPFMEPLREPHACQIEVRNGAVTRIVVP